MVKTTAIVTGIAAVAVHTVLEGKTLHPIGIGQEAVIVEILVPTIMTVIERIEMIETVMIEETEIIETDETVTAMIEIVEETILNGILVGVYQGHNPLLHGTPLRMGIC